MKNAEFPTQIVSITAEPLDLPLTEPFAIAGGAPDVAHNVLVRVTLASGVVGLGEGAPFTVVSGETQASTLAALAAFEPLVVGRDVRTTRTLAAEIARSAPDAPAARCALEMALFDALARTYRVPLHVLFGGAGTSVETDMTITAGDAEHAANSARAIAARGIKTIKVKVGALSPQEDAIRVAEAAHAAPGLRIYADANGGYDARAAQRFLQQTKALGVDLALFEQPLPRSDNDGLLALARSVDVLICADESARTAPDVAALIRSDVRLAINIKPMKCGVVEALAQHALARAAGLPMMIGGMVEGPLAMTFSACLAAGRGGFSFVDLDTPMFVASHPFRGGFAQNGGLLTLDAEAFGHGVELANEGAHPDTQRSG